MKSQLRTEDKRGGEEAIARTTHELASMRSKWRKRMGRKVRNILRRLDRLERAIRNQRKALREFQGVKAPTYAPSIVNGTVSSLNAERWGNGKKDAELASEKFRKQEKPPSKENKRRKAPNSRNIKSNITTISTRFRAEKLIASDASQPQCRSHTGCKPGFCCQKASSGAVSNATCVHYSLKEGTSCEHSCACEAQLQCFKGSSDRTAAACKTASARDILEGVYLNTRDTSF